MFRFENTEFLYLLLVIPVLTALFVYALRDRKRRLERFGDAEIMKMLMPEYSLRRARLKFELLMLALVCLIVALARPQYGSKLKAVQREGIEIMLAIDVSNSMLAEDFEPNRLERTKYAVDRLLEGIEEDKIGVIVFAGDAYVQLPITSDYVAARNFVSQIAPNMVTKQGTAIGAAISLAASSFSSQSGDSRVLILVTDGENHEDNAEQAARAAAEQGITIYTIGMGTPEGAPIEVGGDFIRDDKGEIVVSKLDEESLQKIALMTGGAYIRSTNQSVGLNEIVAKINSTAKAQFETQVYEEYGELFQYLVAAALFFLLLSRLIMPRRNRWLAKYNIFK